MKTLKTVVVAGLSTPLLAGAPAIAQNPYVIVAKGSEGLIRAYDDRVRDVKASIPASLGTNTACGTVNGGNLTAFYCHDSRSIYITEETLRAVGNQFGVEGIATLVAHEYAHARLHAVQGLTGNVIWSSVVDELQADCVAGVYMKAATPIELTSKMISNAADFVESIGDYLVLEKDWHGTPEMRKAAFKHGYADGKLSSCVASERPTVNQVIEKTSETIQRQVEDPNSEVNRLIRWGNNLLQK